MRKVFGLILLLVAVCMVLVATAGWCNYCGTNASEGRCFNSPTGYHSIAPTSSNDAKWTLEDSKRNSWNCALYNGEVSDDEWLRRVFGVEDEPEEQPSISGNEIVEKIKSIPWWGWVIVGSIIFCIIGGWKGETKGFGGACVAVILVVGVCLVYKEVTSDGDDTRPKSVSQAEMSKDSVKSKSPDEAENISAKQSSVIDSAQSSDAGNSLVNKNLWWKWFGYGEFKIVVEGAFTIIYKDDPDRDAEKRYKATLVIRRKKVEYELYVDFGAPIVPGSLDHAWHCFVLGGKVFSQKWTPDTTSTAMFYKGDVPELINSMKNKKWFYPQFIDDKGDMFMSSFDVTGVLEKCVELQSRK